MIQRAAVTERDFRTMMRIVTEPIDSGNPADPMPHPVLAGLQELIPCDGICVIMFDATTHEYLVDQDLTGSWPPSVRVTDELDRVFWTHYWGSASCHYPDTSGDLTTVTLESDFHSDRELRSEPMYCDYSKLVGMEREMMLCLPSKPGRVLRVLFYRGADPDFSPRDRDLAVLLRPHLYRTFRERLRLRRPQLTPRQEQLIELVATGLTNRQIARRLAISEATVRKHLANIFERLQMTSRTAVATYYTETRRG